MIQRFYECTCDYCGSVINHYTFSPSQADLEDIGAVVKGRKMFCDEKCYGNYRHDLTVNRAANLKQFAHGKSFERI